MSEQISTSPYVSYAAQLIEAEEQGVFQYGVGDVITQLRNYAEGQLQTPDRQEQEDLVLAYVMWLRGLRRAMPERLHTEFAMESAFLFHADVHEVLVHGSKNGFVEAMRQEFGAELFDAWAADHINADQVSEIDAVHKQEWLSKVELSECRSLEELSRALARKYNQTNEFLESEREAILERYEDDEQKKPKKLRNSDPKGFEKLIKARDLIFQGNLEDGVAVIDEENDDDLQALMYAACHGEIYEELRTRLDNSAPPREIRAKIIEVTHNAHDAEMMKKALLIDYINMQLGKIDTGYDLGLVITECQEFGPEFYDEFMDYFEPEILAKCTQGIDVASKYLELARPATKSVIAKVLGLPVNKDEATADPR